MKFEFVYGMIRGFYTPRSYSRTAEAEESGNRLKAHGINCVALVVNQYQETFHSTRIFASNVRMTMNSLCRSGVCTMSECVSCSNRW